MRGPALISYLQEQAVDGEEEDPQMRRLLWVLGASLAGFFVGGKVGGFRGAILASVWGAGMGLGFGTIFDAKVVTRWTVVYWGISLALLGPIITLLVGAAALPETSQVGPMTIALVGVAVGSLVGLLVGTLQLKRFRRKEQVVGSSSLL